MLASQGRLVQATALALLLPGLSACTDRIGPEQQPGHGANTSSRGVYSSLLLAAIGKDCQLFIEH